MRIRHFGFLSNRHKAENIKKIRTFLGEPAELNKDACQSIEDIMFQLTGIHIALCPHCKKGKMRVVSELPKNTHSTATQIIRPAILQKAA